MKPISLIQSLKNSSLALATLAMGFAVSSSVSASPIILLEDDFNGENGGNGVRNYDSFTNWNVTDGSVDLLGPGLVDFLPGNGIYIDLNGSTNNGATLASNTTFEFQTGDQVTLMFALAGPCENAWPGCANFPNLNSGSNEVTVSLGGLLNETFTKDFDTPLETISRTFNVNLATSASLVFDHNDNGGDNIGLILDNVQLSVEPSTSIPEPTMALSLLLVGGFLIGRRIAISETIT